MSLRDAKQRYEASLLSKKNVIGVGEGEDDRVVVFVTQKEPEDQLSALDLVERYVVDNDGEVYRTDVDDVGGEFHALAADDGSSGHVNGLRPGASVGRANGGGTGTCGMLVRKDGKLSILSNNHVIGGNNGAPIGSVITHPGPADGSDREPVAKLTELVQIHFSSSASNRVDAAVAEITDDDAVRGNDDILGPPIEIPVGAEVTKTGRTTGKNDGKVIARNVTVTVNYGGSSARFVGQIATTKMLSPGDSGSVGHVAGSPWGLGYAGSSQRSLFNPLKTVFDLLDLTDIDTDPPETPPIDRLPEFLEELEAIINRPSVAEAIQKLLEKYRS